MAFESARANTSSESTSLAARSLLQRLRVLLSSAAPGCKAPTTPESNGAISDATCASKIMVSTARCARLLGAEHAQTPSCYVKKRTDCAASRSAQFSRQSWLLGVVGHPLMQTPTSNLLAFVRRLGGPLRTARSSAKRAAAGTSVRITRIRTLQPQASTPWSSATQMVSSACDARPPPCCRRSSNR